LQALHEPAFILAAPLLPAAPAAAEPAAGGGCPPERTLHCCYACSEGSSHPVALVATDERGELLASRLLPPGGADEATCGGVDGSAAAAAAGCRAVLAAALEVSQY